MREDGGSEKNRRGGRGERVGWRGNQTAEVRSQPFNPGGNKEIDTELNPSVSISVA